MAKRYDVKGKTYFKYPYKYYYTDVCLRNVRLNYRQYDPGHIIENIIYNELLRREYFVDVGVVTDRTGGGNLQKEIDYVVNDAALQSNRLFAWPCRTVLKRRHKYYIIISFWSNLSGVQDLSTDIKFNQIFKKCIDSYVT